MDLRKAYDMVSWEFVEEALMGYGFPTSFIHLIMACVTSLMFTVKINGEGYGFFAGKKGFVPGRSRRPDQRSTGEEDRLRLRDYLWGSTEEARKVPLVSWEQVCIPKKFGGLNIKSSKLWNMASVGRLLWQLVVKEDVLWIKWVNALKAEMQVWYSSRAYLLTPEGKYSLTQSYNILLGQHARLRVADLIWTRFAQPKQRFILWQAMEDRLLTKERRKRLNIPVEDDTCCLCEKSVEETHIHMFSTCEWIVRVQTEMQHWSGTLIPAGTIKHILNRLRRKNWQ
ncbi:hypothetical protein KY289_006971 [Solanum tuberosum]|nr:hypothetical protein KY289_006971 [Solanum tuberosum]